MMLVSKESPPLQHESTHFRIHENIHVPSREMTNAINNEEPKFRMTVTFNPRTLFGETYQLKNLYDTTGCSYLP